MSDETRPTPTEGIGGDESLVQTFQNGDSTSLEVLLKRYEIPLRYFIRYLTWMRDEDFIDEVIQETSIAIFEGLKKGGFDPTKGLFKNWVYGICRNIGIDKKRDQARQPISLSKQYLELFPADLEKTRYYDEPDELTRLEELEIELHRILGQLSEEKRRLLILVKEGKTYPQIQKIPPFDKYSIVNLRRMVCDARTFIYKEKEKWQKKRKT